MQFTSEEILNVLQLTLCCVALVSIVRVRASRTYWALCALLCIRLLPDLFNFINLKLVSHHIVTATTGYRSYFFVYWTCFAADSVLSLCVIMNIFGLAMKPLKGLERLGTLVFRWAAAMSLALAFSIGLTSRIAATNPLISVVSQLQRFAEVLILCLLVFVCFAIRPLGLSFRSRVFGVSLGMGVNASAQLVFAAILWSKPSLHSVLDLGMETAGVCTLVIWIAYFALPEPKARIIVLPTTSPYLRWNQISEALGDEPGFVAVAGVPPEVFSPAEVEIMFRASAKMRPMFDEPYSVALDGPEPSLTSLSA